MINKAGYNDDMWLVTCSTCFGQKANNKINRTHLIPTKLNWRWSVLFCECCNKYVTCMSPVSSLLFHWMTSHEPQQPIIIKNLYMYITEKKVFCDEKRGNSLYSAYMSPFSICLKHIGHNLFQNILFKKEEISWSSLFI